MDELWEQCYCSYLGKDYNQLRILAEKYLKTNRDWFIAQICGFGCYNLGRYMDAEEMYLLSLELQPNDPKTFNYLLLLYETKRNFEEYEKIYDKLIREHLNRRAFREAVSLSDKVALFSIKHSLYRLVYKSIRNITKLRIDVPGLMKYINLLISHLSTADTNNNMMSLRIIVRLLIVVYKHAQENIPLDIAQQAYETLGSVHPKSTTLFDPCENRNVESCHMFSYILNEIHHLVSLPSVAYNLRHLYFQIKIHKILASFFHSFSEGLSNFNKNLDDLKRCLEEIDDSYEQLSGIKNYISIYLNGNSEIIDHDRDTSQVVNILKCLIFLKRRNYGQFIYFSQLLLGQNLLDCRYTIHLHAFLRFWQSRCLLILGFNISPHTNDSPLLEMLNCEILLTANNLDSATEKLQACDVKSLSPCLALYYEYIMCLKIYYSGESVLEIIQNYATSHFQMMFDLSSDFSRLNIQAKRKLKNKIPMKSVLKYCETFPLDGYGYYLIGLEVEKSKYDFYRIAYNYGFHEYSLLSYLVDAYVTQTKYETAKKIIDRATSFACSSNLPSIRYLASKYYYYQKDYHEAIKMFSILIKDSKVSIAKNFPTVF
ncbi:hypothetical protein RF11_09761 [Thelohanellus kitauei]|uniref:Uncharacterized protein n=1 Tax=Thelohanellus kitauei TaxID=669202 RepID=A0A0C2MRP8_THEKT|nr:hypothetical protein RF11_09761 [Thelohanellus kitauei]